MAATIAAMVAVAAATVVKEVIATEATHTEVVAINPTETETGTAPQLATVATDLAMGKVDRVVAEATRCSATRRIPCSLVAWVK